MITTTCDLFYTFGSVTPDQTNVTVSFCEDLLRGRGQSPINTVVWTHIAEFSEADGANLYDGVSRTESLNTLNYADGFEVQIPSGGPTRYVGVWATKRRNEDGVVVRAYLMRHSVA
jgi:hypothetical protein